MKYIITFKLSWKLLKSKRMPNGKAHKNNFKMCVAYLVWALKRFQNWLNCHEKLKCFVWMVKIEAQRDTEDV